MRLRSTSLLVAPLVASLAFGCKSDDKGGDTKAASAATAATGGAIDTLFGAKPGLPAEVAAATFGGAKADVQRALGTDSGFVPSKAVAGASYNLRFSKADELESVSLQSAVDLEPVLTKLWGAPVKTKKGEAFWFAPETGTRAWLPDYGKGKVVAFSAYESLTSVIGGKGFELALTKDKPLLGEPWEGLHATWGGRLCDYGEKAPKLKQAFEANAKDSIASLRDTRERSLDLCRTAPRTVEHYSTRDTVRIGTDGKVAYVQLAFPTGGSPELTQQLVGELDAKFGTATEVKTDYGTDRYYFDPGSRTRAIAIVGDQNVMLRVSRYLPAAELLGGDAPGLGIEKPAMIGGTFEQIRAADPEHFRQSGELAALIYPPTEYGGEVTEINLDRWAHEKKTYGYSTVLHHTHHEPAGDQVFELLKQKFGEPKRNKRSTATDVYYDFAKNGRKISARRVSQQWQLRVTK